MCRITLLFTICILTSALLAGQIEVKMGEPLFPEVTSFYDIGTDPSQIELWQSVEQPKNQPYRFALPTALSLTPQNSGTTCYKNGETIWVVALTSKEALSLNLIFEPFNMPEGAYAYVYDYDREIVRGAFTAESAAEAGLLAVMPVPGDKMIVECHFPGKNIPSAAVGISQVSHDFAGFFNILSKDAEFGSSGDCEVDLACSSNVDHLLSARSVCRILIDGAYLCTGSLVNNTGSDSKAYLLTAFHCIGKASEAASSVFVFNYVSPWCNGPDHRISHSISGASLLAANNSVDFALLELSSFPPLVFEPYLSGWNISTVVPDNTFVIHHPSGDIMKVSVDNNPPSIASFPNAHEYVSGGFWKILEWDSGTTEEGSSGSPLFDQDNRLRGTLTGGDADCDNPVNDYFARIDKMFAASTNAASCLAPWLDPVSSGLMTIEGRDPYADIISSSDTLANIASSASLKYDPHPFPGYGYSTGINNDSLITYAERFDFTGTGEIAWANFDVAKSDYLNSGDTIRVFVFEGGPTPGRVIASKKIRLSEIKDDYKLKVDFDKAVNVTGSFFVGYRVYYKTSISSDQSQFAIYHSETLADNSLNTAWFNNGTEWLPFIYHPTFPAPVSLSIEAIIVDNSLIHEIADTNQIKNLISVRPNPFPDCVSFYSEEKAETTKLIIYDHSGTIVFYQLFENVFPGELTPDLPSISSGIYHYVLWNDLKMYTGTLIKVK